MKRFTLIALLCTTLVSMQANAQTDNNSDYSAIELTITGFLEAGDQNDVEKLAEFIDDNYRVVMNQLFGSTDVLIISKDLYIEKIGSKEWGGDTRIVTIENILVNGNTASARVISAGSKATFISTMILIKDNEGNWKLITDIPIVE